MSSYFSNIHSTFHTLYFLCSLRSTFVIAIVIATVPYIKNNTAELSFEPVSQHLRYYPGCSVGRLLSITAVRSGKGWWPHAGGQSKCEPGLSLILSKARQPLWSIPHRYDRLQENRRTRRERKAGEASLFPDTG